MIPHICTRLCDPDEGVHCLPHRGTSDLASIEKHQRALDSMGLGIAVLKVQREDDVTPEIMTRAVLYAQANGYTHGHTNHPDNYVGFLIWLKDKDPSEQISANERK